MTPVAAPTLLDPVQEKRLREINDLVLGGFQSNYRDVADAMKADAGILEAPSLGSGLAPKNKAAKYMGELMETPSIPVRKLTEEETKKVPAVVIEKATPARMSRNAIEILATLGNDPTGEKLDTIPEGRYRQMLVAHQAIIQLSSDFAYGVVTQTQHAPNHETGITQPSVTNRAPMSVEEKFKRVVEVSAMLAVARTAGEFRGVLPAVESVSLRTKDASQRSLTAGNPTEVSVGRAVDGQNLARAKAEGI